MLSAKTFEITAFVKSVNTAQASFVSSGSEKLS